MKGHRTDIRCDAFICLPESNPHHYQEIDMTPEQTKETADRSWGQDAPPKAQEDVFAIVELMGHARYGGRLTEEEKFGDKVGRIDAFDGDDVLTIYFSAKSVYRITIVSEAVARQVSKQTQPAPVQPWDFPKQLPAPTSRTPSEDDDDDAPY